MSTFDQDEQIIHHALSQITVKANGLSGRVKNELNQKNQSPTPRRVPRSLAMVVAISAVFVITATAATAAALGNFDWLLAKINPSFGEIVEPMGLSCEDQGIRLEVLGAQKYDNMAVVYLSLQDISGQNRLTKQTEFRDGFSVNMPSQKQVSGQTTENTTSSWGWKQNLLYLDEETNTAYYEFIITVDAASPLSNSLELSSFLIYFDTKQYEHEPIPLSLASLGEAETMPLPKDYIFGHSGSTGNALYQATALTTGYDAPMPHGQKDQWISNIGFVDGRLHVQTGKLFNKEFGSSDLSLFLRSPDGQLLTSDYEFIFLGDGNSHPFNLNGDYDDVAYKYSEAVFTVSTKELADYTLCFTGSVSSGVKGHWKVAANLKDTSEQMRIWTNDIAVEGQLFQHLTFTPLGLHVMGIYEGVECTASLMSLAVETTDGLIPLEGGGGGLDPQKQTFHLNWSTKTPLDVSTVTALIINGTKIPLE